MRFLILNTDYPDFLRGLYTLAHEVGEAALRWADAGAGEEPAGYFP